MATAAYDRYERYKRAQTLGEYVEICQKGTPADAKLAKVDFQNDLKKGYLTLLPATEKQKEQKEVPKEIPVAGASEKTAEAPRKDEQGLARKPLKEAVSGGDTKATEVESLPRAKPAQPPEATKQPKGIQSILEDQTLFSIKLDQPKMLEPKKKPRQTEAKPKEAKSSKPKADARAAADSKVSRKPANKPTPAPKSSKILKVLHARDFVRDVVMDYVEGQPDPPLAEKAENGTSRLPSNISPQAPIAPANRSLVFAKWMISQGFLEVFTRPFMRFCSVFGCFVAIFDTKIGLSI